MTNMDGQPGGRGRRARSVNGVLLQISAISLSFMVVALLIVTSSHAAFVARTENLGNAISSATVSLTDNDSSTAMFANVTGMTAGQTLSRCIEVTYTGSVDPGAVLLYAPGAPTGDLAPYLDMQIDIGNDSADGFSDCTDFSATAPTLFTGTLTSFSSTHSSHATGLTTWNPGPGPETRTFRFRLTLRNDPDAANKATTFGFSWETRGS